LIEGEGYKVVKVVVEEGVVGEEGVGGKGRGSLSLSSFFFLSLGLLVKWISVDFSGAKAIPVCLAH
jgi:hypothetical protein